MSEYTDEFTDLLGVYALDAVEPDEREQIELHLLECPRCRSEVAEHREVASYLAQSGADAPDGVWDRIVSELAPPAPPMRLSVAPPAPDATADAAAASDGVVPISAARSAAGRQRRTLLGMLAAAACIVAALGFVAVGQSQRLDRLESAMTERTVEGMANDAIAASDSVKVSLTGPLGSAEAVVDDSGQGYLITEEASPAPDGQLYQLWGKVDGTVLSLGTFGGASKVIPFSVDPARIDDIELFAVTVENAPGVVESTNEPVLAGTV